MRKIVNIIGTNVLIYLEMVVLVNYVGVDYLNIVVVVNNPVFRIFVQKIIQDY